MWLVELTGWIGVILLTVCGFPQLYKLYKFKKTDGLSLLMLLLWWFGEILTCVYVFLQSPEPPLLFNYMVNILVVFLIIFLYVKYKD